MSSRGLDACTTTASFSKYRTAYVKLNNSLQPDLRNDDDKLTENYISALERVGLEDKLNAEMIISYYIMHPGGTMSNATKIECVPLFGTS